MSCAYPGNFTLDSILGLHNLRLLATCPLKIAERWKQLALMLLDTVMCNVPSKFPLWSQTWSKQHFTGFRWRVNGI